MKWIKPPRFLPVVVTVILLAALALSGCTVEKDIPGGKTDLPVKVDDVLDVPVDTTDVPDDGKPADGTPDVPDGPLYLNKLTGLETTEELADIRPVAIMINNIYQATPQQGIINADVMYEILAEGGITRLLCLFTDYASLPETGSIRSSRDYYIDIADAHDAIYVHCGGSPAAYETLAARKTDNMDGIYFNTPFYRNEWRKKNMGMEHSMMTTGERLVKGIEEKGYRTTSDAEQPLKFRAERTAETGDAAEYVSVKYSYYATSEFAFDSESGLYTKKQFDAPHIDSNTGETLAFENILLLYADQGAVKGDDKGRLFVNFTGTGDGLYVSGGKSRAIKWSRSSRTSSYTLYEADGSTELLLNPGKTYIGIPPLGAETTIKADSMQTF